MDRGDRALLVDFYELTMAESYFQHKKNNCATFDLFVRQMPDNRSFLVACGLADVIDFLRGLRFGPKEILYLKSLKLFSPQFLKYLRGFKFRGDLWAMPEGTVFFPGEPVLRITGPIIEAQIVESFLLNTVNLQTMIASKAIRAVLAAKGRKLIDFALRRTHGSEAALKAARSSYIAGFNGTSNVLAAKNYGLPLSGTMAHSYIMSFKTEEESFTAYSQTFADTTILLVDTYNPVSGIKNAVRTGLSLKKRGFHLRGIRIDSGDAVYLSKLARKTLDQAGLKYVKIIVSGNLDEFRIERLLRSRPPIDSFGVGTNIGVSIDAPALDVIYKISEVTGDNGVFLPTMKLSRGKTTYPGCKQVYRLTGERGVFLKDIIALDGEKAGGRKLLVKVIDKGKLVYKPPSLDKIRASLAGDIAKFPKGMRDINRNFRYSVEISPGLERLTKALIENLKNRQ